MSGSNGQDNSAATAQSQTPLAKPFIPEPEPTKLYRRWWHYVLGTNTYRDTGYTRENPFPKPVIPAPISYVLLFLRLVATMIEVILIANMFVTQQFAGRQSQIFIVIALAVVQIGFGLLHTWKMRHYELTVVNLLVMIIAIITLFAMPNLP